uniref:Uncharacterized protein n=1 Tax=Rhizophora mucronata TaxID=61149 RepID=A0A2P2P9I6_RHIMU
MCKRKGSMGKNSMSLRWACTGINHKSFVILNTNNQFSH